MHLWQGNTHFNTLECRLAAGGCGVASRKRLSLTKCRVKGIHDAMSYHSGNNRMRTKHTKQECEGTCRPQCGPPRHFYNCQRKLKELQARDLQWEAFSSSTRSVLSGFYEVQSELLFPTNPSATFPEDEEFALNPEEKYLCMDFYDLKSVVAIDLSPFFWQGKAELGADVAKICALCDSTV